MIPRTLVPSDVRPVSRDEAKEKAGRALRNLHGRPHRRPLRPFRRAAAQRQIQHPAHFPLGVLVNRTLVGRGMRAQALRSEAAHRLRPVAVLDPRVVVPAYVEPPELAEIARFDKRRR